MGRVTQTSDTFTAALCNLLVNKPSQYHTVCHFELILDKKHAEITVLKDIKLEKLVLFVSLVLKNFYGEDSTPLVTDLEMKIGELNLVNSIFTFSTLNKKQKLRFKRVEVVPGAYSSDKIKMKIFSYDCEICGIERIEKYISNAAYEGNVCRSCFDYFSKFKWPEEE